MFTTPEVARLLNARNPSRTVTEDRIRNAIRSGLITAPPRLGIALAWRPEDLRRLAAALGLNAPQVEEPSHA